MRWCQAILRTPPTTWTASAYGHPRKTIIDLLQKHVSIGRPLATVQVASGVKTFTPMKITKAIYGTGWDGTVVLEADVYRGRLFSLGAGA